ncbi:MAG: ABC transporter ATP-binding protein [Deltaproteobacteria bacterium]|nr:MAG: ABC transporter ATP-binding protein [Deltaproteobacteria bacterium]
MIEVKGLTKYFDSFRAIEDLNFTIEKGEIVGFIGPNGSGKTTTMRILTCFMPPTKGSAKVAGYDVVKDSLKVRNHIGYMPEGAPLYSNLPVSTYLEFVAEVKGMKDPVKKKRIAEVMDICGISHVANRFIEHLSKGYRQRVCLAQTILNDPEVLILDEPTIGLDPKQVVEVRNLIKQLAGQRTVMLSSHILTEVSMICDRVIIINKGRLIAQDSISELSKKAQKQAQVILKVRKAKKDEIDMLLKEFGVKIENCEKDSEEQVWKYILSSEKEIRSELTKKIIQKGWELLEISVKSPTLEEIYLRLITES